MDKSFIEIIIGSRRIGSDVLIQRIQTQMRKQPGRSTKSLKQALSSSRLQGSKHSKQHPGRQSRQGSGKTQSTGTHIGQILDSDTQTTRDSLNAKITKTTGFKSTDKIQDKPNNHREKHRKQNSNQTGHNASFKIRQEIQNNRQIITLL